MKADPFFNRDANSAAFFIANPYTVRQLLQRNELVAVPNSAEWSTTNQHSKTSITKVLSAVGLNFAIKWSAPASCAFN